MAFWTTLDKDTKDPKRNFRFIVQIPALGGSSADSTLWFAKKIDKPNFSVTEAKHSFLNHTFYWPGRVEWQKITLTMVDPVSPDIAGELSTLMKNAGYKPPSGPGDDQWETMSKAKFATALGGGTNLGEIVILQLDGAGDSSNPVEKWTLKNSFVTAVKHGSLDYENDDLTEFEVELRYDWAEMKTLNVPAAYGTK